VEGGWAAIFLAVVLVAGSSRWCVPTSIYVPTACTSMYVLLVVLVCFDRAPHPREGGGHTIHPVGRVSSIHGIRVRIHTILD